MGQYRHSRELFFAAIVARDFVPDMSRFPRLKEAASRAGPADMMFIGLIALIVARNGSRNLEYHLIPLRLARNHCRSVSRPRSS